LACAVSVAGVMMIVLKSFDDAEKALRELGRAEGSG
jgi:hypothetical protein